MKKLILATLIFFAPWTIDAEIIETEHFNEIYQYVDHDTLILLDIDNTLIEPVQELGSNQWFEHQIQEYIAGGMGKQTALDKALREWTAIQSITKVKLCEPGIDNIVEDLQLQGFTVMGLTTRGLGISTRTIEQLETVRIDLSKHAPSHDEVHFMNGRGVLFRGGILFTAATHKGQAVKKLCEKIQYLPKKIVFVNDKLSHLLPVQETCDEVGVPFIGLRYNMTDPKVKGFNKQIADVQHYFFGHILSDEAAERILNDS